MGHPFGVWDFQGLQIGKEQGQQVRKNKRNPDIPPYKRT